MCKICIPLVLVIRCHYSIYPETDQFNSRWISHFYALSPFLSFFTVLLSVFLLSPPCILPSINLIHPPASLLYCPSYTPCFLLALSLLLSVSLMFLSADVALTSISLVGELIDLIMSLCAYLCTSLWMLRACDVRFLRDLFKKTDLTDFSQSFPFPSFSFTSLKNHGIHSKAVWNCVCV